MSGLRRKAVVKSKPRDRQRKINLNDLVGVRHMHFCSDRDCRLVYEDSCTEPESSGLCDYCRTGSRSAYMPVRDPQECCLDNCKQVTDPNRLVTFQLAGPGPWFQCKTCARCHGWPCTTERTTHG